MEKAGRLLVDANLLTEEQLATAVAEQQQTNDLIASILVRQGAISERQLIDELGRQYGLQPIDLDGTSIEPSLSSVVPSALARRAHCVPVRKSEVGLELAMVNPEDTRTVERIQQACGLPVTVLVAGPEAVDRAIAKLYANGDGGGNGGGAKKSSAPTPKDSRKSAAETKALGEQITRAIQESAGEKQDEKVEDMTNGRLEVAPLDPPIVRLVNAMLLQAISMRASDVHIEPMEEELRVRYRIDGALVETSKLPNSIRSALTSRVKILCSMNIAEKRIPQDGAMKFSLNEKDSIDFRVNTLPSIYGEKIVMRILGRGQLKGRVDELGLKGRSLEILTDAVANPYGMILVTGPTGSGKTTTLYTILSQLNDPDVNIVTAEEPVEYRLNGITQVNVRPSINFTFDVALRAFLRQDPDVILVGEMRDFETAAIAVKAALTGHLVLSTLHTNDTASTVVRLVDMGIEPYLVASAVKVVIAQRLVRKVCDNCREEIPVSEAEKTDADRQTLAAIEHMFRGKGCDQCNNSGYRGRVPIFEVMGVKSRDMRRAITEGGTEVQVLQVAKREGLRTLADEALELVNDGTTSLEEALRHIMVD